MVHEIVRFRTHSAALLFVGNFTPTIPSVHTIRHHCASETDCREPETAAPSAQRFVLLVEAEATLGLDLADVFEAAGYIVAGPIRLASDALAWAEQWRPACAIVDVSGPEDPEMDALLSAFRERGIPTLVLSDRAGPVADAAGSPRFIKPIPSADLLAALHVFVPQDPVP